MKNFYLLIFLFFLVFNLFGQVKRFEPSSTLPVNLNSGTNWTSGTGCVNSGTKGNIVFNVSGLQTPLSSTFSLNDIRLTFNTTGSCGRNLEALWLMLKKMPSGPCYIFYDGYTGASSLLSSPDITLYLRDNPSCGSLRWITFNTTFDDFDRTTSGNTGYFRSGCNNCAASLPGLNQSSSLTLSQAFNNIDPNGEWRLYAYYNGSAGNAPCISNVVLSFGDPTVSDRRPDGDNCINSITYNGNPFCAQTISTAANPKTPSQTMPGYVNPGFGTINGVNCDWNSQNNNDVWIRYQPSKTGYVCLNISGLSTVQQSIVVTDRNIDNDNNPCTQLGSLKTFTNDPYWTVVSCGNFTGGPYPGTPAGTTSNQQHCFLVEQNKTYYLIVDGNGGVETTFYVSGLFGTSQVVLSMDNKEKLVYNLNNKQYGISMDGTVLKTNISDTKYNQEIIIYDDFGRKIFQTRRIIKGYSEFNLNSFLKTGFNVVKILVDDKKYSNFTFKLIKK